MNKSFNILAAASMAAGALWLIAPATAAPISSSLGLQNVLAQSVETVQYRRGYRGRRIGGAGLVAGAIIGGAILGATQPYGYYGYGGYDSYGYNGYNAGYAYAPGYNRSYYGSGPVYAAPGLDPNGPYRQCWVSTDKDRGFGYYRPC
jgi:hypothetical protein